MTTDCERITLSLGKPLIMNTNKSFKYWIAQEVEETFGVKRIRTSPLLERWLAREVDIPVSTLEAAEVLRTELVESVDYWNEATLKFLFIGPLCALVRFNTDFATAFSEQPLILEEGDIKTRGNIDFMVASGKQIAREPFYLLHEYKPENKAILDPKGQLLIAMVAAQRANENIGLTQPVYGSYVLGRFWFFVVLNGKEYSISRAYDATQEDDFPIVFRSLHAVRLYIAELFGEISQ